MACAVSRTPLVSTDVWQRLGGSLNRAYNRSGAAPTRMSTMGSVGGCNCMARWTAAIRRCVLGGAAEHRQRQNFSFRARCTQPLERQRVDRLLLPVQTAYGIRMCVCGFSRSVVMYCVLECADNRRTRAVPRLPGNGQVGLQHAEPRRQNPPSESRWQGRLGWLVGLGEEGRPLSG